MHENEISIHHNPPPLFFSEKNNSAVQCLLCPNKCIIDRNKKGNCLVRGNKDGKPDIPFSGKLSAIAIDPIEKKPLYHFHPGSQILSAGFFGCNLKCPFCQNYSISRHTANNPSSMKTNLPNCSFASAAGEISKLSAPRFSAMSPGKSSTAQK